MPQLTPCLWFDTEGEDAAQLYTSVFPNSKILEVTRYGAAGPRPEGTVMTVSFELDGQKFLGLNGRTSRSMRPSPSRSRAATRTRSTTTGRSSARAASPARAAG